MIQSYKSPVLNFIIRYGFIKLNRKDIMNFIIKISKYTNV